MNSCDKYMSDGVLFHPLSQCGTQVRGNNIVEV